MIVELKKSAEQKMQKTVDALKHDYQKVRTGRAHTGLLDHIQVDYYGSMMPINQVANDTLAEAPTIPVLPWEQQMVQAVDNTMLDSHLGLHAATSGDIVPVTVPA